MHFCLLLQQLLLIILLPVNNKYFKLLSVYICVSIYLLCLCVMYILILQPLSHFLLFHKNAPVSLCAGLCHLTNQQASYAIPFLQQLSAIILGEPLKEK